MAVGIPSVLAGTHSPSVGAGVAGAWLDVTDIDARFRKVDMQLLDSIEEDAKSAP